MSDSIIQLKDGDTILYNTNGLSDSDVNRINNILNATTSSPSTSTNNTITQYWDLILIVFIAFVLAYIIPKIIEVLKIVLSNLFYKLNINVEHFNHNQEEHNTKNYIVYNGNNLGLANGEIKDVLEKYFVYYRNLELHLQNRFYERLICFMNTKQFIIYSNEPFKEMPILISAAAIQISFGLDSFELPHYNYIQIHKEEYFAENSLRVLAGNVQGNCITLAWNQLLKGYSNDEDGNNVGLHEMAHALYFQEIMVDTNNEASFDFHFNELMYKGETVLQQKVCPYNIYTDYAFTNLQEFWAVSVELFFERTNDLNIYYPQIFETLKNILNQNPLIIKQPI